MTERDIPPAAPPQGMTLHQLPTGSYATPAMFAFRGGSPFETRHFAATPVLVSHPRGDLLIDAGFGRRAEEHIASLPRFRRSKHELGRPVIDQLADAGYDAARLSAVLLTHSHWDHVSGIADLDVPVLVTTAEQEYAEHATGDRVFAEVARGRTLRSYEFESGPYLGFDASHDLYGDGSVVVVPAGGHTTGSVVVFVALPGGERYGFVGDLVWQSEGIERGVDRPLLLRALADSDPRRLRDDLQRLRAIADRVTLVPAHDARAFRRIPLLEAGAGA